MNDVLFRSSPQRSTPVCLLAALDFLARGWSPIALCPADHAGVDAAHERLCNAPGGTPLWSWKEYQQRLPSERELHVYWKHSGKTGGGTSLGKETVDLFGHDTALQPGPRRAGPKKGISRTGVGTGPSVRRGRTAAVRRPATSPSASPRTGSSTSSGRRAPGRCRACGRRA